MKIFQFNEKNWCVLVMLRLRQFLPTNPTYEFHKFFEIILNEFLEYIKILLQNWIKTDFLRPTKLGFYRQIGRNFFFFLFVLQ